MLIYLFLLLSFTQVTLFGLGGDPAAQALLEHETLTLHKWLTPDQLTDLMTMSRCLPGGSIFNTAVLTGYTATVGAFGNWGGVAGSLVSALGLIWPAVLWAECAERLRKNEKIQLHIDCILVLLRPLVPGLIAAAALLLMNTENFGSPTESPWQLGVSIFLFLAALIGMGIYKIHAGIMILLCGIAGWILF